MRRTAWLGGLALVGVGYLLGSVRVFDPQVTLAQGAAAQPKVELLDETQQKLRAAADALRAAADSLTNEQKYQSATKGLNVFAILSGGRNVIEDLENGAIVDPETFAALYADLAVDQVAVHLGRDDENRLTYKGKVIKIFPVSYRQRQYALRSSLTGEELTPSPVNPTRTKPAASDDNDQ